MDHKKGQWPKQKPYNVMMNDPGRNFWNSRNSNREFLDNDLAVSRGISQRAAKFLDTQ